MKVPSHLYIQLTSGECHRGDGRSLESSSVQDWAHLGNPEFKSHHSGGLACWRTNPYSSEEIGNDSVVRLEV